MAEIGLGLGAELNSASNGALSGGGHRSKSGSWPGNTAFQDPSGGYSPSGFAIPLGLAEIGLGLGAELNSASNGALSGGGHRSKSGSWPGNTAFQDPSGGYSPSGFAIPLGLAGIGLGLGAELNSASNGALSGGGHRSKSGSWPGNTAFQDPSGGYSPSGFAIPLGLAEIGLGLGAELNSASNGALSGGVHRSKSGSWPGNTAFQDPSGGYSSSGFAIPLGLAEIGLGLGAELNSASNGALSGGGHRSKSGSWPGNTAFQDPSGGYSSSGFAIPLGLAEIGLGLGAELKSASNWRFANVRHSRLICVLITRKSFTDRYVTDWPRRYQSSHVIDDRWRWRWKWLQLPPWSSVYCKSLFQKVYWVYTRNSVEQCEWKWVGGASQREGGSDGVFSGWNQRDLFWRKFQGFTAFQSMKRKISDESLWFHGSLSESVTSRNMQSDGNVGVYHVWGWIVPLGWRLARLLLFLFGISLGEAADMRTTLTMFSTKLMMPMVCCPVEEKTRLECMAARSDSAHHSTLFPRNLRRLRLSQLRNHVYSSAQWVFN